MRLPAVKIFPKKIGKIVYVIGLKKSNVQKEAIALV
jgi:hypothetical protein